MYKFIFILFLFSGSLAAQIVEPETTDTLQVEILPDIFEKLALVEDNGGKVEIKENAPVNELTRIHIQQNRQQKTAAGYRIQIFSGSSYDYTVEWLQQMKTDFETEFPDIPVYLNYFDPDFKIRAGNFRSRLECIPVLKRIRSKYPACYPVKTDIPIQDLKKLSQPQTEETEELEEESSSDPNQIF